MDYNDEEDFDNYIRERLYFRRSITTRKVIRDFQNPFEYYSAEEFKRRYRFPKDIVINVILPLINITCKILKNRLPKTLKSKK